mmetsp:Transcript_154638/g.495815  ORF Transcript_154638/g.495815 Transcript_154638/m.495815 type:complete len:211 (+) Transcript_154638:413-1045(+)
MRMAARTRRPCSSRPSRTSRFSWMIFTKRTRRQRRLGIRAPSCHRPRPARSTPCGPRSARATKTTRRRFRPSRITPPSSNPRKKRKRRLRIPTATPQALPTAVPAPPAAARPAAIRTATATRTVLPEAAAAAIPTPTLTPVAPTATPVTKTRMRHARRRCCGGSSRQRPKLRRAPRPLLRRTRSMKSLQGSPSRLRTRRRNAAMWILARM